MNIYRLIGDRVGTLEARGLAQQLVEWHDAMVKHLRVIDSRGGSGCLEGCPHEDARALWAAAMALFGPDADDLVFLRAHGAGQAPPELPATPLYA